MEEIKTKSEIIRSFEYLLANRDVDEITQFRDDLVDAINSLSIADQVEVLSFVLNEVLGNSEGLKSLIINTFKGIKDESK